MSVTAPSRLKRYMAILLRWLLVAFAVFVLSIRAGRYITENLLFMAYTATATIHVVVGPSGLYGSVPPPTASLAQECAIIGSPDVLLPVIHDLGLNKAWASSDPEPRPDEDALARMSEILKIESEPGRNIVKITVSSNVPKEAADIANAISDQYKIMRDLEEIQRASRMDDVIRDEIARQQRVVDEKKAALEQMPRDQSPAYLAANRDLEQQQIILDALNVRLKQAEADEQLQASPVRILSRAEAPKVSPKSSFESIVTILVAAALSVFLASFVEVVFLFLRASEMPPS